MPRQFLAQLLPQRLRLLVEPAPSRGQAIPYWAGQPFLGHALAARSDLLDLLVRAARQHPAAVRIPLGPRALHLFHDLAILRQILVTDHEQFARGPSHRVLRELLGDSLLTVDNDVWPEHRRAAAPAFQAKRIAAVARIVDEQLDGLFAIWDQAARQGQPRAMYTDLMALCAQVSSRTFFDQTLSWAEAEFFVEDFLQTMSFMYRRMRNPLAVARQRERLGRERFCHMAEVLGRSGPHPGLAPQARTILATAPENPANTLSWAIWQLCQNPEIQRQAQQQADRDPCLSSLWAQILRETLRLYPAVWGFERVARADLLLGDYFLPSGATVLVCPYTLHRLPQYWDVPDAFRPTRFAMSEDDPRWAAFLPYSQGPRRCAGAPFMMAVAQALLPPILSRYELTADAREHGALIPVFTLRPTTGILTRLSRRRLAVAVQAPRSDPAAPTQAEPSAAMAPTTLDKPLLLRCGATLRNRLAKAGVTERLSNEHLLPSPALLSLYDRFAYSGAGLLITGNVMIDRHHLESMGNVAIDKADPSRSSSDPQAQRMPLLRAWAAAGTQCSTHLWMQLSHPGRQATPLRAITPVAPSAQPSRRRGAVVPLALAEREIEDIIERFASAAAAAKDAGFTGVQIHAAHGYLLSTFLSPLANQRSDRWGGCLEHRARLLLSVVHSVRAQVGASFPVSVKLNSTDGQPGGFSESDAATVIQMLAAAGVDLLELSGGNYENTAFFRGVAPPTDAASGTNSAPGQAPRDAFFLHFAERVRALTRMPLMLTGGLRSRALIDAVLADSGIDVVGLARPFLLYPTLGELLLSGQLTHVPDADPHIHPPWLAATAVGGFYDLQVQRLSRGLPPHRGYGALRSAAHLVWRELHLALSPRNWPPLRPAPLPPRD